MIPPRPFSFTHFDWNIQNYGYDGNNLDSGMYVITE